MLLFYFQFFLGIFICLLCHTHTFSPFYHNKYVQGLNSLTTFHLTKEINSNSNEKPEIFLESLQELSHELFGDVEMSKNDTMIKLIKLGDCFPDIDLTGQWQMENRFSLKKMKKISGCISNVYIQVHLKDCKVKISGKADSKIAKGMLALYMKVILFVTILLLLCA